MPAARLSRDHEVLLGSGGEQAVATHRPDLTDAYIMGMGRYKDGKFDLVVVANFVMTPVEMEGWRRSFERASELFFDATEGQVQFGNIYVCDDSIGSDAAEIILHNSGDPSYGTFGRFGQPGEALHLMPYVRFQVLTHLHEMGHHVWALGEEYAAEAVQEDIDTTVVPPDNSTIPLVGSSFAPGALVGVDAILKFGSLLERRNITANDATSLTVGSPFGQSPLNDSNGRVQYQFAAECATTANPNFCIMENSRGAAGTLDAAGTWTPAANPVTEFCSASNHDPDGNTQQQARNASSCWETIVSRPGFTSLTAPDPAAPGPTAGFTVPAWIVLDKQPRFAVILDRSGSMSTGHKMADAQHGAIFWLERCAVDDDLFSLVAYDDVIDTVLPLQAVSAIPGGIGAGTAAISALTPRGATDIRDALFAARDQIESRPTRAATQVALLLTDGRHNTPTGSSALEAITDYQEGGIRLYTLGAGAPGTLDMDVLEQLAASTGGRAFSVGDDQAGVIESAMTEINAEVRGGIITTEPVHFPDSKNSGVDRLLKPLLARHKGRVAPKSRPKLADLLKALGVRHPADLLAPHQSRSRRGVAVQVFVEEKADRASFTVVHADSADIWLYLIDPAGHVVDGTSGAVAHVESTAPHEFIVVKNPMAGRWTAVLVRTTPGAAMTARFVAGGENRNLQVFGSASPHVPKGVPVRLSASARWLHKISGLRVTAAITAPSGTSTALALHDDVPDRPNGGDYEGFFTPIEQGMYRGVITIIGSKGALIADPVRQILHSEKNELDVGVKSPRFIRRVVVTFEAGERTKPADDPKSREKPARKSAARPRPVPLVSAKKRRR